MHAKVFLVASLILAGCVDRAGPSATATPRSSSGLSDYGEHESLAVYHFEECARLSVALAVAGAIEEPNSEALVRSYLSSELALAASRIGMSDSETTRALKEAADLAVGDLTIYQIERASGREPDMDAIFAQGLISCFAIDVDLEPAVTALQ